MTIKELAKELKVSPQAVYQRLQTRKIDVKTLTHPVTKELTSEGEFVIRSMYDQEISKALTENQSRPDNEKELEELRKQVKDLIEKNSSLEKRVEELTRDRETFREAMETSQRLQEQMINRFLPASTGEKPEKLTWKERITGRRKS